MPQSVDLRTSRPGICPGLTDEDLAGYVSRLVADRESKARRAMARAGRRFLGVARILRQRPSARPRNSEPRRGLSPRVAARNKWLRIEALRRLKQFAVEHAEALRWWKQGRRDAMFPAGTYAMRVIHGARVGPFTESAVV